MVDLGRSLDLGHSRSVIRRREDEPGDAGPASRFDHVVGADDVVLQDRLPV